MNQLYQCLWGRGSIITTPCVGKQSWHTRGRTLSIKSQSRNDPKSEEASMQQWLAYEATMEVIATMPMRQVEHNITVPLEGKNSPWLAGEGLY